jgi:PPOX class probable F420-dependent enzyme
MRSMSEAEARAFLRDGARTAKLATVRPDGHPHVVPIWFVLHGDEIVMTTGNRSTKARNLRVEPRVALSVDDERPPFAYVMCLGRASLYHRPADLAEWTTRIARRYVGDAAAAQVGQRYAEVDDLLVRVRITSMVGHAELLD